VRLLSRACATQVSSQREKPGPRNFSFLLERLGLFCCHEPIGGPVDPEDGQIHPSLREVRQPIHQAPVLTVVGQRDGIGGIWVIHPLDQLSKHSHEVVVLLRARDAHLSFCLDDVATAVGVPSQDVDARRVTPSDLDP
jgi:hypothetical protein